MTLDLRRSTMRPVARLVPLPLLPYARTVRTALNTRGLTSADIVNSAYPKSGSTWLRFVVADIASDGDEVDFTNVGVLSPPLGGHQQAPRLIDGTGRFIKTHESLRSFPRFPARGLYLVRDGRDVAVSLFHFLRRWNIDVSFDDYLSAFLAGRVSAYGTWQRHVTSWCTAAEQQPDRIAVLRYEDLLGPDGPQALHGALARIGWHVPETAVEEAVRRNDVASMKKKEAVTGATLFNRVPKATPGLPFVRRGTAGQWRETFSPEQARAFAERAGDALELAGYER